MYHEKILDTLELDKTDRYILSMKKVEVTQYSCQCYKDCTCCEDFGKQVVEYYQVVKFKNKIPKKTMQFNTKAEAMKYIGQITESQV